MVPADIEEMADAGRRLDVYADGCYEPESGTGGWAFVAYRDGLEVASRFGNIERSSNNAMELSALLEAATWVSVNAAGEAAVLWSDSLYAVNGCNRWRHIWKNGGWRKKRSGFEGQEPSHRQSRALESNRRGAVEECIPDSCLV